MKTGLAAALIIEKGRVLLVHNSKHSCLRIEPPGGKIREDEAPEDTVVREVKEELGIDVEPQRPFGTYMTHSPEGDFPVHMYICRIISGEPVVLEPEKISGFGWYGFTELLELEKVGALVPNMKRALGELKNLLKEG